MIYLSLGAGVQSTALLVLSEHDPNFPRADVAIFADTQDEPAWVYEHLEVLKKWSTIPIETVTAGPLGARILDRIAGKIPSCSSIPAFVEGTDGKAAPLGRNCTRDHKIVPIQRYVKANLNGDKQATAMIGISLDEAHRMRDSLVPWIENTYPLVDAGLRRTDCVDIIRQARLPIPKKSACVFCPYHSDAYWRSLKQEAPEEWRRAVSFDERIRDMAAAGVRSPVYLHRSRVPLAQVDLNEDQMELFGSECEGLCGV